MSQAKVKRVLLLGWDAAEWSVVTPLVDAGKMPNLQRLIEQGTSGRIATLQPVLSPILWTSIATGKSGDKHAILSFVEPTPRGDGIHPVSSYSRQAKALWNLLSQQDRRSVVVNWFASHPAEPINGAVVSNRFAQSAVLPGFANESAFHPRDLFPVMEKLRVNPAMLTPEQMLPFFLGRLPADDDPRLEALSRMVAMTASVHNAATYLAEAEDWDFLAVYYDMIDHVGHGFAEFTEPKMEHVSQEDFETFRHVLESTYRYHDLMLGRWLELAGDDTAVIVLSDHGFYHGKSRPLAERAHLSGERPTGVHTNPLMWHRLHGLFAASGPDIKRDALVQSASLLDVAPTILALLALPVPEDFEGRVLTQIFSAPPAIKTVPSLEAPHPNDGVHRGAAPEEKDPWAAQQALAQLVELGYIEAPGPDAAKNVADVIEARDSHLAQIHFAAGRLPEALEILDRLATRSVDPSYRCRQAMCLLNLRRIDEADAIVQEVLAQSPHYALARMLAAQTALARDDVATAEKIFSDLQATETEMPSLHYHLGVIQLRRQRWDEAAAFFRRCLEADPEMADAHDGLGVALRHLGQYEDSVYEHMRAVSLEHDRPQTHVNLGLSLLRSQQINWARRAFQVALELAPNEPFPHRCLARLYRHFAPDREKARYHLLRARELRRQLGGRRPAFRGGA